jgi:hypothetical protein
MMRLLFALLVIACASNSCAGESVSPAPPPYLVLRAPARPADPHARQGYYPGQEYAVETHAYNYGWFGAKYGRTWDRQFGYYRNYTQWRAR